MKFLYFAIALSAFQAYSCSAAATDPASTTIVCESCPTTTSSDQIVTRTSAPTTSCSALALTVIPNASGVAPHSGTTTPVPFVNGGTKMAGGMSGVLAVALAAAYAL